MRSAYAKKLDLVIITTCCCFVNHFPLSNAKSLYLLAGIALPDVRIISSREKQTDFGIQKQIPV